MLEPSSSDDDEPDCHRVSRKQRPRSHERDPSSSQQQQQHQAKVESTPMPAANVVCSNNLSAPPPSNRAPTPEPASERLQPGRATRPVSPSPSAESTSGSAAGVGPSAGGGGGGGSATASVSGTEEGERVEREEGERKTRLQLYVFVIRCISYPFNAKQPSDITKRHRKVQVAQFEQLHARFQSFTKGEAVPFAADDEFAAAVQTYFSVFLDSERLQNLVRGGGVSLHDLRETFRQEIKKRIKSLPDPESGTKEALVNAWMTKFEYLLRGEEESKKPVSRYQQQQQANLTAEAILTKDQLYEMFQAVLGIKKFEHQLLFK